MPSIHRVVKTSIPFLGLVQFPLTITYMSPRDNWLFSLSHLPLLSILSKVSSVPDYSLPYPVMEEQLAFHFLHSLLIVFF